MVRAVKHSYLHFHRVSEDYHLTLPAHRLVRKPDALFTKRFDSNNCPLRTSYWDASSMLLKLKTGQYTFLRLNGNHITGDRNACRGVRQNH